MRLRRGLFLPFSWNQGHGDFGVILEEGVTCPPGLAFGEYSERVWVELAYPTTLHRGCFIACQMQNRGRDEVIMMQ